MASGKEGFYTGTVTLGLTVKHFFTYLIFNCEIVVWSGLRYRVLLFSLKKINFITFKAQLTFQRETLHYLWCDSMQQCLSILTVLPPLLETNNLRINTFSPSMSIYVVNVTL